jgi:hypothetical protein
VKGNGNDGLDASQTAAVEFCVKQPGKGGGRAGIAPEFEGVDEFFYAAGVVAEDAAGGEEGDAAADEVEFALVAYLGKTDGAPGAVALDRPPADGAAGRVEEVEEGGSPLAQHRSSPLSRSASSE